MGNCAQGKQTKGQQQKQKKYLENINYNVTKNKSPDNLQVPVASEMFSDQTKVPSDNHIDQNQKKLAFHSNTEKPSLKEIVENVKLLQKIREDKLKPRLSVSFDKSTIMNKRRGSSYANTPKSSQ